MAGGAVSSKQRSRGRTEAAVPEGVSTSKICCKAPEGDGGEELHAEKMPNKEFRSDRSHLREGFVQPHSLAGQSRCQDEGQMGRFPPDTPPNLRSWSALGEESPPCDPGRVQSALGDCTEGLTYGSQKHCTYGSNPGTPPCGASPVGACSKFTSTSGKGFNKDVGDYNTLKKRSYREQMNTRAKPAEHTNLRVRAMLAALPQRTPLLQRCLGEGRAPH